MREDYEINKKEEAARYFLDLIHSGNRYDAVKYYSKLDEETRDYMRGDANCEWELLNSFRELES